MPSMILYGAKFVCIRNGCAIKCLNLLIFSVTCFPGSLVLGNVFHITFCTINLFATSAANRKCPFSPKSDPINIPGTMGVEPNRVLVVNGLRYVAAC